jgi:ATP-dependent Lon protease
MATSKSLRNDKKYNTRDNSKKKLKKNKDSDDEGDMYDDEESLYETMSDTSDSSYKPPKSKKNKHNFRKVVESDDDDDETLGSEDTDDDDESDDGDDDESGEDITQIISRIFPSKYANEKMKNYNFVDNKKDKKKSNKKTVETRKKPTKKNTVSKKKDKNRRRVKEESEEEDDDDEIEEDSEEDSEDSEEDSDYDEEESEEEEDKKIDIIFTIGGADDYDDEEEYNDEDDMNDCNSDDEKTFMKENYEEVEKPIDVKKDKKKRTDKKNDKKTNHKKVQIEDEETADMTDVEQEYLDLVETKKSLSIQLHKKPKSKILLNAIDECNHSIKKLIKKARIKNAKNYHKLINKEKKYTNEVDYFKKKLSNKEQLKVMKDLKEINTHLIIEKPYRLSLLESKMPSKFKSIALQKLNVLKNMDPSDSEYYKIKNWVDTFMKVPFCTYKNLSVKMEDGIDVCHNFMTNAKNTLDTCVYGLNDAKIQIMQMVGQWIANPSALGTAIAIKGPPGTGKTSLVKEGISKILGREFAFIALGGTGDSSFLEGHSYTYEGSSWGKIVQILIDSKCMNPVIYFDELDKVSDTPRGEEIIGILTHLTDTSQNSQFHDKYFSDIDFDLSKCLFIFSYNDESKVNPILRDRMYRIQTKGYEAKEKIIIARDYLLPKIREQVNFTAEDIIIPDDTIQYIVSNSFLTKDEAGVRNLKRCLEIIHTKLNLFRLVKPDANIFDKDMDLVVNFPITVTRKVVDTLIKNEENQNQSMLAMYC